MYRDISDVFLNSIRAIRFYIDSVDQTMDTPINESVIYNDYSFGAAMIYSVVKAKEKGIKILDETQTLVDVPQKAIEFIKGLEDLVQEIDQHRNDTPFYSYLPKNIKKEYQKFEAREKQKEILYRGSLLLVVTYFENLIASVLRENFAKYPQRIALNEKSVSYKMLTEVNDIEEIKDILIDQEVTNKMYESLLDWKNYFQKNIKLELKAWEEKFDVLQEIIARRNLYVHNNGIINNIYIKLIHDDDQYSLGEELIIDREYIDESVNTIEYLGMSLLIESWLKECSNDSDEVKKITDLIFEEYLEPQRWVMARYFYGLCLQNSRISDADKILCKINNWQCYKWLGEYDKIKREVDKLDVSACKPMYVLGILALKEDYNKFFEYYDNQTDIGETELKEWPLFMELRKSEEYLKRFSEVENRNIKQIECTDTEDVTE